MKTKKLILYIGGFELPDKNAAAHRVIANAKAFKAMDYDVALIGISKDQNSDIEIWRNSSNYGFQYLLKPYPRSIRDWINHISKTREEIAFIQAHKDELLGVILYNHYVVASLKIRSICKRLNIPVYGDCTEWYSHKKSTILGMMKHLDSEIRMRVVHKTLDGVIVISRYLHEYYKDKTHTVLIPPLVDRSDEKWMIIDKDKNAKSNEEFCIVYAGSPGDSKDRLDLIINAVQGCELNITLKIIGITKEVFQKTYPSCRVVKDKSIFFLGRLIHSEVLFHLASADYTWFLRDETRASKAGFPTKFVESITAGIPVITNKTSDIKTYAERAGGCILVDDLLPSTIESSLKYAYKNSMRVSNPLIFDYHNYLKDFSRLLSGEVFNV